MVTTHSKIIKSGLLFTTTSLKLTVYVVQEASFSSQNVKMIDADYEVVAQTWEQFSAPVAKLKTMIYRSKELGK